MQYANVLVRLVNASRYSLDGLAHALKHEQAFRYEAIVLTVVCVMVVVMGFSAGWALALIGAWVVVMCLELVNSAVEKAFDLIDQNFRPEIKAGKDMLSASVFIGVCFNIVLWGVAIIIHT